MTQKRIDALVARMTGLGLERMSGDPYRADSNEVLAEVLIRTGKKYKVTTFSDEDLIQSHQAFCPLFRRYVTNTPDDPWVDLCQGIRAGLMAMTHTLAIVSRHQKSYWYWYQASIRYPGIRSIESAYFDPEHLQPACNMVAMQIARILSEDIDPESADTRMKAMQADILTSCREGWGSRIEMDVPVDMNEGKIGQYRTISIKTSDLVNLPFEVLNDGHAQPGDANLKRRLIAARERARQEPAADLRGCRVVTITSPFNNKDETYLVPPAVLPGGYGIGQDSPGVHAILTDRFVSLHEEYRDVAEKYGNGSALFVTMYGQLDPSYFLTPEETPEGIWIGCDFGGHHVKHRGRKIDIRGAGRAAIRESILSAIEQIDEAADRKAATPIRMKALHLNVIGSMSEDDQERVRNFMIDLQEAKGTGVRVATLRTVVNDVEVIVRPSKAFDPIFTIGFGKDISLGGTVLTFKKDVGIPHTVRMALKGKPIDNLAAHPLLIGAVIRGVRDMPTTRKEETFVAVDLDLGPDIIWTQDLPLAA